MVDDTRKSLLLPSLSSIISRCSEAKKSENTTVKQYSCEYGSPKYYALCGFGGVLSCGLTHTMVVTIDLVKCRIQTNSEKYKNIRSGIMVTLKEEGPRGLVRGWSPTLVGYSLQGLGKFGLYEVFKNIYGGLLGDELSYTWRTSLYLASSASAELFADILLCPMEALKVRIQTQPGFPNGLFKGAKKMIGEEGLMGFYKGIVPLWGRQIPYTMMKFASFERIVESFYKHVFRKPRDEFSKEFQLVITLISGYLAGVFCAIVSHPADVLISKLNKQKGSSIGEICRSLQPKDWVGGLFARIIMVGTLTSLQWFIYDFIKVSFALPRPPPPEMPESLKKKIKKME